MVKVVAKHYVQADKVERFIALAKKLVAETQAKDAGCIHYDLLQDRSNSQVFAFIEEWESQALLDRHMQAGHFKEIVPQLGEFAEKEGTIDTYQIVE